MPIVFIYHNLFTSQNKERNLRHLIKVDYKL